MKTVYTLAAELERDPAQIAIAQALTLDSTKQQMGLAGTYGLFASPMWWQSIENGVMPLKHVWAKICRLYTAGQDDDQPLNSFDARTEDGIIYTEGICLNDIKDFKYFQIGKTVKMIYALDPLKELAQKKQKSAHSAILLELSIEV